MVNAQARYSRSVDFERLGFELGLNKISLTPRFSGVEMANTRTGTVLF
jgi:hypothetical protein